MPLSNVPDHIVARLKQREPERSVASWAFRYAGSPQDGDFLFIKNTQFTFFRRRLA